MKYETPELTTLPSAINAVQGVSSKTTLEPSDGHDTFEMPIGVYQDWES